MKVDRPLESSYSRKENAGMSVRLYNSPELSVDTFGGPTIFEIQVVVPITVQDSDEVYKVRYRKITTE
jgi:hypothetical protein